jgi:hypothetical protein
MAHRQFLPEGNPNKTQALEVAFKKMGPQDKDPLHVHFVGTEVVILLQGRIDYVAENEDGELEPITLSPRNYLLISPGVKCGIEKVFENTEVIVLRSPSVPNDKMIV